MNDDYWPGHELKLTVTLFDLHTGISKRFESGYSEYFWCEGSGCCDCNRYVHMGIDHLDCKSERFLVVEVEGIPDEDRTGFLMHANEEYDNWLEHYLEHLPDNEAILYKLRLQ